MSQQFHAIFEHSVLRPLTPLNLPELAEVTGTLQEKSGAATLPPAADPLLSLMADEPEVLDQVVAAAMTARAYPSRDETLQ